MKLILMFLGFALAVALAGTADAQTTLVLVEHWRAVTPAELAQKQGVVEPDADAEAIFWEVKVDDSMPGEIVMRNYLRIKIFTERGREKFSKIDLPTEYGTNTRDLSARVIKPDGSIIELKPEDFIERTVAQVGGYKAKATSFAVPGIEPGVIIEYRYRVVLLGGISVMSLMFQQEIPVQKLSYSVRPYMGNKQMQYQSYNLSSQVKFVDQGKYSYGVTLTNVPAIRKEPMMPPLNEARPWIMLYYSAEVPIPPADYWMRQSPLLYEGAAELYRVNDDIKKAAAKLIEGAQSPDDILLRLYEFCQNNINNLSFNTSMTLREKEKVKDNKSPADTLKRKQGTSAEVDLLFAALTTAAGLETRLAFMGDRSELFFDRSNANIRLIKPTCVAVRISNEWRFIKLGARFLPYGILPWYYEGQDALIPQPVLVIWARTPQSGPEKSRERRTGRFRLLEDGTLEGTVRIEYTGQLAYYRKLKNYDDSVNQREETLRDEIKERLTTAELSDIKLEGVNEPKTPFVYTFNIRVPNYAQKSGKRWFLKPNFFEHGTKALFPAAERKFPMFFHYAWSEEDDVTIELPPGIEIENLEAPAPIGPEITQENAGHSIKLEASADQRSISFHRSFFFGAGGQTLIPRVRYPAVKKLFDSIQVSDEHSIILRQP